MKELRQGGKIGKKWKRNRNIYKTTGHNTEKVRNEWWNKMIKMLLEKNRCRRRKRNIEYFTKQREKEVLG